MSDTEKRRVGFSRNADLCGPSERIEIANGNRNFFLPAVTTRAILRSRSCQGLANRPSPRRQEASLRTTKSVRTKAWFNYGSQQFLRSRFIGAPASAVSGTAWMRDSDAERPSSA